MSTELPPDPADWPSDPFALLGLERGAAIVEIKRAYTRLIKKYKPEQFPEEFRRIREAYDSCNESSRWILDDQPEPEAAPPSELPPLASTQHDETERLWSLAADQPGEAYSGLVRLAEQEPDRRDLPLRLYWLLSLDPLLDPARKRQDWLVQALKRSRLSGPAVELYRRELRIEPEAALYDPYHAVLSFDATPFDKLTVAQSRLSAAGRTQSWGSVAADVRELAGCLPMANEAAWLSFLVTAHDWTVWDRPAPLYDLIRDELDKLQHLELPQAHSFDRVEEARRASKGWNRRAVNLLTGAWLRLVPVAWADGSVELPEVSRAAASASDSPQTALVQFDRVMQEFGPFIVFALARMFDRLLGSRNTHSAHFPDDSIRGLAARLPGGWQRSYESLRTVLLDFLVELRLHPEEFATACEVHPEQHVRTRMMTLRNDLSLKLVWLARSLAV